MMTFMKKWWFYLLIPTIVVVALMSVPEPKALKPYEDYIFYGIAQNKLDVSKRGNALFINFAIKGFPYKRHSVYIEIVMPDGSVDFLRSEEHTKEHKAHYHPKQGFRKYRAIYKIPHKKLGPGKYKLRVRFEFDTSAYGRLKRDILVSNDVKFEIK